MSESEIAAALRDISSEMRKRDERQERILVKLQSGLELMQENLAIHMDRDDEALTAIGARIGELENVSRGPGHHSGSDIKHRCGN